MEVLAVDVELEIVALEALAKLQVVQTHAAVLGVEVLDESSKTGPRVLDVDGGAPDVGHLAAVPGTAPSDVLLIDNRGRDGGRA